MLSISMIVQKSQENKSGRNAKWWSSNTNSYHFLLLGCWLFLSFGKYSAQSSTNYSWKLWCKCQDPTSVWCDRWSTTTQPTRNNPGATAKTNSLDGSSGCTNYWILAISRNFGKKSTPCQRGSANSKDSKRASDSTFVTPSASLFSMSTVSTRWSCWVWLLWDGENSFITKKLNIFEQKTNWTKK